MAADPRSKNHAVHRSRSCPTSGSSCGRSLTDQHIETPKHQRFTSERRLHAARNEDSAAGRRPRDSGDVARNLHHPTPPAIAAQILRATESSLDRRPYHSNPAKMYELPASSFHRIPTDNDRACKKKYILLVCSALMMSGAPTHRLEHYMQSSAVAVGIGLDSFYIPGCIVLSFSASPNQPSEVHIVRRVEALNLSKLHEVHSIYKAVIHGRITTGKAICQLDDISSSRTNRYPLWLQVILYGLTSACFGPISYGARPVDVPIIFLFGTLVGFLQLVLAPKSELYGYVFEMTAAILVSCLGRAFGSISWDSDARFCFSAISQASIVLLLPGFTIICSALELQSKNIVSGGGSDGLWNYLHIVLGIRLYDWHDYLWSYGSFCDVGSNLQRTITFLVADHVRSPLHYMFCVFEPWRLEDNAAYDFYYDCRVADQLFLGSTISFQRANTTSPWSSHCGSAG